MPNGEPDQNAPFGGVLHVQDFGATGDGITDDTAALQTAAQAAATEHKQLFFGPGTYLLSQPIQMSSYSDWFAIPGTATLAANANAPLVTTVLAQGSTISGLRFKGTSSIAASEASLLVAYKSANISLVDDVFRDTTGRAALLSDVNNFSIIQSTFDNVGNDPSNLTLAQQGVAFTNDASGYGTGNYVYNSSFSNIGLDAISATQQTSFSAVGNTVWNGYVNPGWESLPADAAGIYGYQNIGFNVAGNTIENVSGNGIDIDKSQNVVVYNNSVTGSGEAGIGVFSANQALVTGNVSTNNNTLNHFNFRGGIVVGAAGASQVQVSGNVSGNTPGIQTQLYGVQVWGGASPSTAGTVSDNSLSGNSVAAIYDPTAALTPSSAIDSALPSWSEAVSAQQRGLVSALSAFSLGVSAIGPLTISDTQMVRPFSTVQLTSLDYEALYNATVTLANPEAVNIAGYSLGTYDSGSGTFTVAGSALTVSAELSALVVTPSFSQIATGSAASTGLNLVVQSNHTVATGNITTSLAISAATGPATFGSIPDSQTMALTPAQILADRGALAATTTPYLLDLSGQGGRWTAPTVQAAALGGSGLQYAQFADGQLTFDPASAPAQITRLYLSAFGRMPDPAEQHGWSVALKSGTSLADIAGAVAGSAEFSAHYGSEASDSEFVTALYLNVLGRRADAAGLSAWSAQLSGNALTRAQVLADFSQSSEHAGLTAGLIQAGLWDLSEAAAEIARLYDTVFGRLPDFGGLHAWSAQLSSGADTLAEIAADFVANAEFQGKTSALSDTAFVTSLYNNALHRAPDEAGLAAWVGALRGMPRSDVVLRFSESEEHQADTAPEILNGDPAQQGILTIGPVQASAAVIGADLDSLQTGVTRGAVTAINLTDPGAAVVAITSEQIDDSAALHLITGAYSLSLAGTTVAAAGAAVQAAGLGTSTTAKFVSFADGRLVFDPADPASEIYRLYQSALDRSPDTRGENAWAGALQAGTALTAVAGKFLSSSEFASDYGTSLSDTDFVTLLYANALGHAPSAAGLAEWQGALAGGTSRASALVDFSDSTEHLTQTAGISRSGIWDLAC